ARIAAARSGQGWLPVFGTDSADRVVQYQPNIPGWYRFDGVLRAVAAETNADGRMELFGVNSNGTIWHRAQNSADKSGAIGPWGPWVQFDGGLSSIAAARNADGRIELFGSNELGQVFHRSQTAKNASCCWTPWTQFDGPGMVKVAAETNLDGRIEMFGLDGVGHIFHRAQLTAGGASGWSAWTPLDGTPGTLSTIAVARNNDRLELYATTPDHALYYRTQVDPTGTAWTAWTPLGDSVFEIGAESSSDGRVELVATTSSGGVVYRYQSSPGSWAGTGWTGLGAMDPVTVAVPNVKGLSQSAAITALTNAGLAIGTISTTSVSESIDNGKVITQTPTSGTSVTAGTAVNLSIGVWNGSRL
ncbi:tectonin domain-containing protein, partial [Micromonospora chersina]|uniref:tectonin domain-containing protein n=1 Tax=Micromonospora chersina TaxID=47854 RepID=UPI0037AB7D70